MNLSRLQDRHLISSLLALALGAAWIWLSAADPGAATAGRIPAPQAGFLAPDFTLVGTDGAAYTLSGLRGRPILINLWASWCAPCRAEMPAIQRLHEEFQAQGLLVLAVNMTSQDDETAARLFAEEYGLTFPILLDLDGEVGRLYQNRALPSSYFVDPNGVIQEVVIGGPMAEALLRTRVENLFAVEVR